MTIKADPQGRRAAVVPVAAEEKVRVLAAAERAAFIASLEEAEARMKAGVSVEHDPETFIDRLLGIFRATKHANRV